MKALGKFILMNRQEFEVWFHGFRLVRKITLIQNHHTFIPNYTTFNQVKDHFKVLEGMEQSHLQRGFDEIAQNLTIFPDGMIAVCRDLNKEPAGIKGANTTGICIENVGNFDIGGDRMSPEQSSSILFVNALICKVLGLRPSLNTIVYHHWFDLTTGQRINDLNRGHQTKSCPGSNFFGGNTIEACSKFFIPAIINVERTIR